MALVGSADPSEIPDRKDALRVTLSLRTWRYGSRASARDAAGPVGRLTVTAQGEAHVGATVPSALQRWDSTVPDFLVADGPGLGGRGRLFSRDFGVAAVEG